MDKQLALEKVPQDIQIRFSFPPFPGADLTTVEVGLPEGALLLDAVRQSGIEHHIPIYLEHSLLSTAQSLIHGTRKATVDQEARRVDRDLFSGDTPHPDTENIHLQASICAEQSRDPAGAESELELRRAMIENYRNHTTQFYTQPDEVCMSLWRHVEFFVYKTSSTWLDNDQEFL